MSWIEPEEIPEGLLKQVTMLKNMVTSVGESGHLNQQIYHTIRMILINDRRVEPFLPMVVRTCRTEKEIWSYLKDVASGEGAYHKRRIQIQKEFLPILNYIERLEDSPADSDITDTLTSFDADGVKRAWSKALERRKQDPEGAITLARTLLEEVCKHILDKAGETYDENELSKLYSKTSKLLNLSPTQHSEQIFKTILSGCNNVVQGLGSLRNKIGDAHGGGPKQAKPSPRHAALAVNLAGSMAMFLMETWNSRED